MLEHEQWDNRGLRQALSSPPNFSVNGGLVGAIALTFGPELAISSSAASTSNSVLELLNGTTGAFVTALPSCRLGVAAPSPAPPEGFPRTNPGDSTYDWTHTGGSHPPQLEMEKGSNMYQTSKSPF